MDKGTITCQLAEDAGGKGCCYFKTQNKLIEYPVRKFQEQKRTARQSSSEAMTSGSFLQLTK